MSYSAAPFIDKALRATCAIAVIKSTQWLEPKFLDDLPDKVRNAIQLSDERTNADGKKFANVTSDRNTEVTLQDGTHRHANIYGSGFFLAASDGLLLTAEHVRRDCRGACITYASEGAKLVVCPYLGDEIDWSNAWGATVVAHTGSWNPTDKQDLPEHGLAAGMVLRDLVDAALLRPTYELMTGKQVSTPVCIPGTNATAEITALPISTAPLKTVQALYALGFPTAGGRMTPTPVPGGYSLDETAPAQAEGTFLKFTGGEILPGHSGGPIVTDSGVCVAWSVRKGRGVNHIRPIEAAKACIELVMGTEAWTAPLLATPDQVAAHEASVEQASAAAGAAAGSEAGRKAGAHGAAEERARAARAAEEAAKQERADADQRVAELAPPAPKCLPHSPALSSDSSPGARKLFGREDDIANLVATLRDGKSTAKYCLVMGSAGLGKTELVLAAARALVKGEAGDVARGAQAQRFSAILYVELRGVFSEDQVEACVDKAIDKLQGVDRSVLADPAQRAKLLSGALLILDNADDPYEKSRKGIGGAEGWFEGKLLTTYEASCRRLLLTIRDETDTALFQKPSMRKQDTQRMKPLTTEAGRAMLRHEMDGVELMDAEEASILRVCGARGVSPLALSVVCGVLRHEFDDDLFTEADRTSYLADLGNAVARAGSEFSELQTVMEHSIEKVPAAEREAFLQLHLFPDRFTESDAAALWATTEEAARKLLRRLKRASLVDYAATVPQPYLVLDHLWHFADRYARDPNCKWLSRTDQARAIQRLIELGQRTGQSNERLLSAARSHAGQVLCMIDGHEWLSKKLVPEEHEHIEEGATAFRSLSAPQTAEEEAELRTAHSILEQPMPGSTQKRAAPEFKGIGAMNAAYKERKLVAGLGPSAPSSSILPCGTSAACHAGLSKTEVAQSDGLVRAARALLEIAPPGHSKRKRKG